VIDEAETWFSETLHSGFQQRFEISKILFRSKTEMQDIIIFENPFFGRMLVLDGVVQTSERDEACYHEMLAHVPIIAHGAAKEILIIGGGDGGALRDVLKHPTVARATMVEIDRGVVDLCAQYLPSLSAGAFGDRRSDIVFADGVKYVKDTDRRFDVIIIDSTDPIGPAIPLFSDEFYADCQNILTEDGILTCQSGVGFVQENETQETFHRLNRLFDDSALYVTQVPTYAFGFMTLGWGANSGRARSTGPEPIQARFDASGIQTNYYTPAVHAASFSLPAYMDL
jgi:spermidine synthase